jgi:mercuric ion transport protein
VKRRERATAASAALAATGAAVGVAVASACCVGPVISPLIVGLLGAGGAVWAADLEPYSPYILAASGALLGYGFLVTYRRPRECAAGDDAALGRNRRSPRWLRLALWAAALLWAASLAINVMLPRLPG